MQELTSAPQMASPYTPAGGANMQQNAPQLGTPVPGTTGGLPAKPGLSVSDNPLNTSLQSQPTNNPQAQQAAQHTQSYGRGQDTMLVHMTPDEVNSLRGLAQQFGGDLTQNPHTGLPEAGWLGKLLPTILGGIGMAFGIPPIWMGALGAVGGTAITGDLKQGLMAGLGAYGGASLAGGLGVGNSLGHVGADIGLKGSVARAVPQMVAPQAASAGALSTGTLGTQVGNLGQQAAGILQAAPGLPGMSASSIAGLAGPAQNASAGLIGGFKNAATAGLSGNLAKIAVPAAVMGVANSLPSQAQGNKYDPNAEKNAANYEGPYRPIPRVWNPTASGANGEGEIQFFDEVNPIGFLNAAGQRRGYAGGGYVDDPNNPLDDLGFDRSSYIQTFNKKLADLNSANLSDTNRDFAKHIADNIQNALVNQDLHRGQFQTLVGNDMATLEDLIKRSQQNTLPVSAPNTLSTTTVGNITPGTVAPGNITPGTGVPASLSNRILSPGATQSGAGVEVLKDTYTPKFSQKADYVTPYNAPLTLGSQLYAQLPSLTSRYQTSPGAVTALNGYVGGSPSERIRALAQANAAASTMPSVTSPVTTSPTSPGELNFGLDMRNAQSAGTTVGGGYIPGSTYQMPNFATMTPADIAAYYRNLGMSGGAPTADASGYGVGDSYKYSYELPYAKGGTINMRDGAFVVDARTVSELGNGSSNAGIDILRKLGGEPVRGPGDGVSDSVRARIGGSQGARVARDEVIFQPEAVQRVGGAKRLYALMDKAHKARKSAKRGQDTGLSQSIRL